MTHPLVGVRLVEVEDATRSRVTHGFHEDGTMLVTSASHGAQVVWRATGDRCAGLLVTRPIEAEDRSFVGWQYAAGSVEVSEDGRPTRCPARSPDRSRAAASTNARSPCEARRPRRPDRR